LPNRKIALQIALPKKNGQSPSFQITFHKRPMNSHPVEAKSANYKIINDYLLYRNGKSSAWRVLRTQFPLPKINKSSRNRSRQRFYCRQGKGDALLTSPARHQGPSVP
jgi:hypothetical protein